MSTQLIDDAREAGEDETGIEETNGGGGDHSKSCWVGDVKVREE